MVLLRAATVIQQGCGHPLPHFPRESAARGGNDQWTTCCSTRINGRLAAVRRLAYEAADAGLLSPELAAGIRRVKGAKKLGVRLGNWLTAEEARRFWQSPAPNTLRGKRDRAILAVLLGCGLRRRELADLDFTHPMKEDVKKKISPLPWREPGHGDLHPALLPS